MPPGGVRFTQIHTRVYYSGRARTTMTTPQKHREEIFAHVLANNNIKLTQGVTETIKNGTKIKL